MRRKNRNFEWHRGYIAFSIVGLLAVIGAGLIIEFLDFNTTLTLILASVVYLSFVSAMILFFFRRPASDPVRLISEEGDTLSEAMYYSIHPAVIAGKNGRIEWCNDAFIRATGQKRILNGESLESLTGIRKEQLNVAGGRTTVMMQEAFFDVSVHTLKGRHGNRTYIEFENTTDALNYKNAYKQERTVVIYIVIDNIEEILQIVQEKIAHCTGEVEEKLRRYFKDMSGIFRSYDKNKYLALVTYSAFENMLDDRFGILDEIRSVRVGDGMPITLSIGAATMAGTLADRETAAESALDLALQRGGDQAVVKDMSGTHYYGGHTKAVFKRTNVRSRVMAQQIMACIGRADNVLIMGHHFGDLDSFGAAIGMARLAFFCGAKVNVIVSPGDTLLRDCVETIKTLPEYRNVIIDGPSGMDRIRPDTLLIIVDVNNFDHVEYPQIVRNVGDIVIVDHHRKTADFPIEPLVEYIEPSASSASELVAEMLEQTLENRSLVREEAEFLMSGILLDTHRFTRNTGTRTFAAALYLRSEGATPSETEELFKCDEVDVVKEASFLTNVRTYRDSMAITVCDAAADQSYRVIAAKAADKLLSIKNVEASFSLVQIDEKVHISGRSSGKVNVQIILEKLHGGGHFDVAGAQMEAANVEEVVVLLKKAIDDYLDGVPAGD